MIKLPSPGKFELGGGALCLDFVDTLDGRFEPQPIELIGSYQDLLQFALATRVVTATEVMELNARAARVPDEAARSRDRALQLREALFRVFLAVAEKRRAVASDLAIVGRSAARAVQYGELCEGDGQFIWTWDRADDELDRPLWPVALSALELLQHGPLDRVHKCAAEDCGVLFLDTTRNRSRKWCSRLGCGNRSRVRRYRDRQRTGAASDL